MASTSHSSPRSSARAPALARLVFLVAAAMSLSPAQPAQQPGQQPTRQPTQLAAPQPAATAELFDAVVAELEDRYFDPDFRAERLPEIAARYRPAAAAAASIEEERGVVHTMLSEVPASHLALLSSATWQRLEDELVGRKAPMLGCTLLQLGGRFYVDGVYEGGPAHHAGLRRGDLVETLDGGPPGASPLLDWRSDDAWLPDPPIHELLVADGQVVRFGVLDRGAAEPREVDVEAAPWSGYAASAASVRSFELSGHRVLYMHLWFVFHGRAGRLVRDALQDHPDCDALLLDLRGRGGSALECAAVVRAVERAADAGVPTVALIDARTRSAKEVIADMLQRRGLCLLVGERTAGAVLPASFVELEVGADGSHPVLMLPQTRLGEHSKRLEGHGVRPEVRAADPLPPVPGVDPIFDAGLGAVEGILGESTGGR